MEEIIADHFLQGGTPDIEAATVEKMMADHCPLGRCATPEDVARVVAFLMSEDGGWVNGKHFEHHEEAYEHVANDILRSNHHNLWWIFPIDVYLGFGRR